MGYNQESPVITWKGTQCLSHCMVFKYEILTLGLLSIVATASRDPVLAGLIQDLVAV